MKVDVHLPRIVVLIADCIVQRDSSQIISYNDSRDCNVIVQGSKSMPHEGIKIKRKEQSQ